MDPALMHEVWVGIRFVLICMVPIMLILFGLFEWERRFPSVKQYPFRADLRLHEGGIFQMVTIVIPARTLDQAKQLAEGIGKVNDTDLTFNPEFRL